MDIEQSLDDIERALPRNSSNYHRQRQFRGKPRKPFDFGQVTQKVQEIRQRDSNSYLSPSGKNGEQHILVSNLNFMVTEEDMRELFSDCGTLEKCCINYDKAGRSRGTAEVVFSHKKDAITALNKYNNVPLDGRPLILRMTSSFNEYNVTQSSEKTYNRTYVPGYNFGVGKSSYRGKNVNNRESNKTKITKETLDADLDAYMRNA